MYIYILGYDMLQKFVSPVFFDHRFGAAWLDCMYHTVSTYLPHTNKRMSGKTQDALATKGDFKSFK